MCINYGSKGPIKIEWARHHITRYQSTLAGSLHSLLFVHITNDSGLDVSGHIDLSQRWWAREQMSLQCEQHFTIYRCQEDPNFQKYIKGSKAMLPQVNKEKIAGLFVSEQINGEVGGYV